jgi:hypothetical protein
VLYACVAFVWILALFGTAKAVFFWRNAVTPDELESNSFVAIGFGPGIQRGAARAFVPRAFVGNGIALTLTAAALTDDQTPPSSPSIIVGVAGTLLLFGGFALVASIAIFNRPKFLLPRYLRNEAGALVGWWRGRKNERGRAGVGNRKVKAE